MDGQKSSPAGGRRPVRGEERKKIKQAKKKLSRETPEMNGCSRNILNGASFHHSAAAAAATLLRPVVASAILLRIFSSHPT